MYELAVLNPHIYEMETRKHIAENYVRGQGLETPGPPGTLST